MSAWLWPMVLGWSALLAVAMSGLSDDDNNVVVELPYAIDCTNPYVCQSDPDPSPHCTESGSMVFGQCGLQIAICVNHDGYDPGEKCFKSE